MLILSYTGSLNRQIKLSANENRERSSGMNQYQNTMKFAALSENDIESINSVQSRIKTLDDKEVILVAYEK